MGCQLLVASSTKRAAELLQLNLDAAVLVLDVHSIKSTLAEIKLSIDKQVHR
jgi:hypothetical protein